MAEPETKQRPWGVWVALAFFFAAGLWWVRPGSGQGFGVPLTTWYWVLLAWAAAGVLAAWVALMVWLLLLVGLGVVAWVCLHVAIAADMLSDLLLPAPPGEDGPLTKLLKSEIPSWWHS